MNIDKLIQSVAYILSKNENKLNYTKLIKILYLSDRKAIFETGVSISSDTYVSMKDGPVLSGLYDLIKNKFSDKSVQFYWNSKFQTDGYDIYKIVDFIPKGELSDSDTETFDLMIEKFKDFSYSQMIDYVHNPENCPEWKNTHSSIPLKKSEILHSMGFSDEIIQSVEDEDSFYQEEKKLLDSLNSPVVENYA